MFDLVSKADEEPKIVCGVPIDGRFLFVEAALKLPKLVCAMFCAVEYTALRALLEVLIFDRFGSIVGVQQIGPRDNHQDDVGLGFETDLWIIEYPDSA